MEKLMLRELETYIAPQEVFVENEDLLLTSLENKAPVKFNAQILFIDDERIGLHLPNNWWKILQIESGMQVAMVRLHRGGMYTLQGKVEQVNQDGNPTLLVRHQGEVTRNQRRYFYRVPLKKPVLIKKIRLPEGEGQKNMPAILTDISAGGIGFNLSVFLPPESKLWIADLMQHLLPETKPRVYAFETVWCSVSRPFGYRMGAKFLYDSGKEQDEMVGMVNRLQMLRIAQYYHIIKETDKF